MGIVTLQIYKAAPRTGRLAPSHIRTLLPENLVKTIQLQVESEKPLTKDRAKRAIAQAFPQNGKPWFIWEHQDGWLDSIDFQGEKAWVLVCRHTTSAEA